MLRNTVVIPTYWSRPSDEGWQEGDGIFDHPTPIDKDGTLLRTLESMKTLRERNFKLVILICPTAEEIEQQATDKVKEIIARANLKIETYIFTPSDLETSMQILKKAGAYAQAYPLLNLKRYPTVRNVCLFCATILSSEVVILIDDDEVFEIPDFISRSVEFIGKRVYGDVVHGVAGYYINKDDKYYDDVKSEAWMTYWDRFGAKARAFDKIIGKGPRIKRTPFAFGGAMVMNSELFQTVPFDPHVGRGEDIDYLINSRMYGFSFFLDNTLSIKHLPEPKSHPRWRRLREDMYRFVYEKAKIDDQYETGNMVHINASDFDPYPGEFLADDLEEKIYRSNMMLAAEYMAAGNVEEARESLENIHLSKTDAPPEFNVFTVYRENQKHWEKVIKTIKENRYALRSIMEENNLSAKQIIRDKENVRRMSPEEIAKEIRKQAVFGEFSDADCDLLARFCQVRTFFENEKVFSSGDTNDSINLLLKGRVSLQTADSEDIEISILEKGDFFGESGMARERYTMNGVALEFTEVLSLPIRDVDAFVKENPKLAGMAMRILIHSMSDKLMRANARLQRELANERSIDTGAIE